MTTIRNIRGQKPLTIAQLLQPNLDDDPASPLIKLIAQ